MPLNVARISLSSPFVVLVSLVHLDCFDIVQTRQPWFLKFLARDFTSKSAESLALSACSRHKQRASVDVKYDEEILRGEQMTCEGSSLRTKIHNQDKWIIGYEFYWRDDIQGYQFVRAVTERRRDSARITPESIMNLGRKIFGKHTDMSRVLIVTMTRDPGTRISTFFACSQDGSNE